jgi:hypothetical protein
LAAKNIERVPDHGCTQVFGWNRQVRHTALECPPGHQLKRECMGAELGRIAPPDADDPISIRNRCAIRKRSAESANQSPLRLRTRIERINCVVPSLLASFPRLPTRVVRASRDQETSGTRAAKRRAQSFWIGKVRQPTPDRAPIPGIDGGRLRRRRRRTTR